MRGHGTVLLKRLAATHRRRLLFLFLLGLAFRVGFLAAFGVDSPLVTYGDDTHYDQIARTLVFDGAYRDTWFPPGYPLFLALLYRLFGTDPVAVRLLQAVIGAATACLTYQLGRLLAGERVGLLAALLLAAYPGHLFMSWRIMAETLFIFLTTLSVYLATRLLAEPRWPLALGLGLSLGAMNVVKSNLILFAPLLLLWLAVVFFRRKPRCLKEPIIVLTSFLAVSLLTPALNYITSSGEIHPVAGNAGHTLWFSNNPWADGYFIVPSTEDEVPLVARYGMTELFDGADPIRKDRLYAALAVRWSTDNPGVLFKLCLKKLANAFGPIPRAAVFAENPMARWAHILSYGILMPFMLIGLGASSRRCFVYSALYLVIVAYTLMVLIFYGTPRFTIVVMPLLLIAAAGGLTVVFRRSAGANDSSDGNAEFLA